MNRSSMNKAVIALATLTLVLVTVSLYIDEFIQISKEPVIDTVRTRFGVRLLQHHYIMALEYDRSNLFVHIFPITTWTVYVIWISNLSLLGYACASLLILSEKKWTMLPSLVLSSITALASLFALFYYPFRYSYILILPCFISSVLATAAAAVGHFAMTVTPSGSSGRNAEEQDKKSEKKAMQNQRTENKPKRNKINKMWMDGPTKNVEVLGPEDLLELVDFNELEYLDSGTFSHVYAGKIDCHEGVVDVVIKNTWHSYGTCEVKCLKMVRGHSNFIELMYYYWPNEDKKITCIVLPRMSHNLRVYVKEETLPSIERHLVMFQILTAQCYLESIGLVHLDIKPANVLINIEDYNIRISDFGNAREVDQDCISKNAGTLGYRPPEHLLGPVKIECTADAWACAVVWLELICRTNHFRGKRGSSESREARCWQGIINFLGQPSSADMEAMGASLDSPVYLEGVKFSKSNSLITIVGCDTPAEELDIIGKMLVYAPQLRFRGKRLLASPLFNYLFNSTTRLANGRPLPYLEPRS